jgi:hypothetical protein
MVQVGYITQYWPLRGLHSLKNWKMASDAAIRVYVLEGQYAQLSYLGFPVSLLMELQRAGLRLDNAKWSTRLSDAGFSVSFFWPAARQCDSTPSSEKKRKPRSHPNFKIANGQVGTACTRAPLPSKATATASFKGSGSTPIDAHPLHRLILQL